MSENVFFQNLAVMMSIAGIIAVVFSRLGWPKVLGYIAAGVFMSEYTWGGSFLEDAASVQTIGQLGVVFLMFAMGISFSPREMKRIRAVSLPCAIIDTIVMIWLGYTLGTRLFGWSPVQSMFLGVAICDSATTLLVKMMGEMGWSERPFARFAIGTSICEDIICVGAIAVVTGFARGGGMSAGAFLGSLGGLMIFFLAVLVFGFVSVPRLLKSISKTDDDEALLLTVLGTCFFVSYIANRFDFSLALGAFLVGVICGTSDLREKVYALVDPLKSMFAAVFFVSIGLLVDPTEILNHAPEILIVSLIVVGGKFVNVFVGSVVTGLDLKTAIQHSFSLAQIGEFAFMVAILYAGIVQDASNPLFQIGVGVSLLTTLLNPLMIRISDPVGNWVARRCPERLNQLLSHYQAWLSKLGASADTPEFILLRTAAIKLGIYAVLMAAVSMSCMMLAKFDYARFSIFFEHHDKIFFFLFANVFSVALLPLVLSAARALADEVVALLAGGGEVKWQIAVQQLVRFIVVMVVLVLFFLEWSMLVVALVPSSALVQWISFGLIVSIGAFGWRYFTKAGSKATKRFTEALTAEERREGLVKTITVSVPEGTIHRFTLNASSPAVGGTVVTLNIRAKTGASIVSVYRNGVITRNVGPDWEFAVGDTLIALGEPNQIAALKDLLGVVA